MHARTEHLAGCAWFWVWAVVGFGLALGAISLGPLVLLPLGPIGVVLAVAGIAGHARRG
ncbi:MAG TPA: hypothetical protein VLK24_10365 [Gaiellaceae bacterium]|nr:hypothetical protein [Gaiellaceae bacterium]